MASINCRSRKLAVQKSTNPARAKLRSCTRFEARAGAQFRCPQIVIRQTHQLELAWLPPEPPYEVDRSDVIVFNECHESSSVDLGRISSNLCGNLPGGLSVQRPSPGVQSPVDRPTTIHHRGGRTRSQRWRTHASPRRGHSAKVGGSLG